MTRRPKALVGAAIVTIAVLAGTQVNARQKQKNPPHSLDHSHSVGATAYGPHYQERPYSRSARIRKAPARHKVASWVSTSDPRPHRWCAWWLRRELGVPKTAFPKWSYNIARSFRYVGTPASGPAVGVVVVWPRHVGYITRRTATGWVVKSGNDGGAVRERERSLRGVIAYRWVSRSASKPRPVIASLPPQRERKSQSRIIQPAPWTVTAAYVEPDFEPFVHPPTDRAPEPITPDDRKGIFRRYVESQDVVVGSHTSLTCRNGKPVSAGLQRMVRDASAHFRCTAYVNSGCRTPERNRKVGGARNSQHLVGRAVDFRLACVAVGTLRGWVLANAGRYGVKGVGRYSTHVHADDRVKATKMVLWTGGKRKATRYAKHRKPSRYAAAG